ncbi:ABC transporter ATPase [Streptomyces sp. CBMA291]|uniref:ABC transporter ATPase n=1 Tax=Streptomyces sp. CBMA291 TaxID=1930279 RepID=UPI00166135B1|nr:ABC transporter ATPase [Streptomyces sp. CBMA291]MBD0711457.1 ABC transporter ATPase [Streptomyces sp. CBMA291]
MDFSLEATEAARRASEWALKVDGLTTASGRDVARARARLWARVARACAAVAANPSPSAVEAAGRALDAARRQERAGSVADLQEQAWTWAEVALACAAVKAE